MPRRNYNPTALKRALSGDKDLAGEDLVGADLTGVDLEGADLTGADLSYAKLRCTDLSEAKLFFADLSFAKMIGTNLTSADLTGANLTRTQLYRVVYDDTTLWPNRMKKTRNAYRMNAGREYWGKAAAGAVIFCTYTGRILLGKRSYWVNEPHTWGGFGGAVEPGEWPAEGALREVQEETGLEEEFVESMRLIWTYKDGSFRYYNFLCSVPGEFEPLLSDETSEADWFDLDDLPSPLHFGFEALLPHLQSVLESGALSDVDAV